MLHKKLKGGTLPTAAGIFTLFIISAVLILLYSMSGYLIFLLAGFTILLPAEIITALCLFKGEVKLKNPKEKVYSDKKFVALLQRVGEFFVRLGRILIGFYNKYRIIIKIAVIAVLFLECQILFASVFRFIVNPKVAIWQPIAITVLLVFAIVVDKVCKHTKNASEFLLKILANIRVYMRIIYAVLFVCIVSSALKGLALWDIDVYVKYIIAALYYYMSVFMAISLVVTIIRKELDTQPKAVIPIPFIKSDDDNLSVIDFLENNTGITMRGLWSMRYVKQIAPITALLIVVFLWLSTCIIQIDPYSKGAVYRLGSLSEKILEPGLHFVLPYPLDKVDIYNTESVNKLTIGYSSTQDTDNVWTGEHGKNEYKLLLGGGDELVSINIRVEYKIKDLKKYLTSTCAPEQFLEAQAYELVTDRTITTSLATLLSTDRDAFAKTFETELGKKLDGYDTGIEIVSIVLESIHPPLEVASVYQEIISAEIEAEEIMISAQCEAETKKAEAQQKYDTAVGEANANHSTKVANARTEIAEFMAGVEAYKTYPSAYRYYKYLGALKNAYGNANLVIVGDGVDSSKIYFGSFNAPSTDTKTETTEQ